jgi:hypothetical protein
MRRKRTIGWGSRFDGLALERQQATARDAGLQQPRFPDTSLPRQEDISTSAGAHRAERLVEFRLLALATQQIAVHRHELTLAPAGQTTRHRKFMVTRLI